MKIRILVILCLNLFFSQLIAEEIQLASLDKRIQIHSPIEKNFSFFQKLEKRLTDYPEDHEAEFLKAVLHFKEGNISKALSELDQLIKKVPDFQLAYLLKGDLILSRFSSTNKLGQTPLLASLVTTLDTNNQQLSLLREEARLRLNAFLNDDFDNRMPRQILALGESVKKAILVDKSANRLYVFEKEETGQLLVQIKDFYISTGKLIGDKKVKGDLRTPEGVYFVTSWINPEKLPDKYGIGAFPVNYPNELDKHNGKTGYGIWLHGTDKGYYSRPPRDSEGCVVLTNIDLESLKSHIEPGVTPVVIANEVEWIKHDEWINERESLLQAIENWRLDWQSMDVDKYLSHYGTDFWSVSHNLKSWSSRKRYLAKNKIFQKIALTDMSLLVYPQKKTSGKKIAVVRLRQDYQSNNFNGEMSKRLYLEKKDNNWKIIYEGR